MTKTPIEQLIAQGETATLEFKDNFDRVVEYRDAAGVPCCVENQPDGCMLPF